MEIRKAGEAEIAVLTALSGAAFDSDTLAGAAGAGGPPGYDDEGWHRRMLRMGCLYTLLEGDEPVGGLLLFPDREDEGVMYLGRIFIDPARFRQGLGRRARALAEARFPGRRIWRLDTPIWNQRTNAFYTGLGYREVRRDGEFVYYEKEIH